MANNGFIKVASISPTTEVGNVDFNTEKIITLSKKANENGASLLVFPELCISGYTCADLFFQEQLLAKALQGLIQIKHFSSSIESSIIVGLPLSINHSLYNCAAFISKGKILGIVPKSYLPNYNEFYERRWFSPSKNLLDEEIIIDGDIVPLGSYLIFSHQNYSDYKVGIEICEDLWTPIPPSTYLSLNGATIIANPSASNEVVGKSGYRKSIVATQSAKTISSYIYTSAGYGESTTDLVYGGHTLIYENGSLIQENERFSFTDTITYGEIDLDRLVADRRKMTSYHDNAASTHFIDVREIYFSNKLTNFDISHPIDPHPFVPSNKLKRNIRCKEIFSIQTMALAKRIQHIGIKKVVIGVSGGLDSTLALLVCVATFDALGIDHKNIVAVTMPGFGTTDRTYNNALSLINHLGCTLREISIHDACLQHFKDIEHDIHNHNITYENSQARERTQILMDLSNKEGAIVIGTGDLSELALGWATYNGDHMSMYAVNVSIPKTLVRYLVQWVAHKEENIAAKKVLLDILATPVSPELLPPDEAGNIAQKTEDVVGPYELHDFFLYQLLRYGFTPSKIYYLAKKAFIDQYDDRTVLHWLKVFYKRFFSQQFKRSCIPDGPKVGSICLSPRGDLRMPSDASVKIWLDELEKLSS